MLGETCWQCGALGRCKVCGSTETRKGRRECAECHRRRARDQRAQHPGLTISESALFSRLLRDDFADVQITAPVNVYLTAFDAWLREPINSNFRARTRALVRLEGAR